MFYFLQIYIDNNSPVANYGYEGTASYNLLDNSFAAVENNIRYEREEVDFSK